MIYTFLFGYSFQTLKYFQPFTFFYEFQIVDQNLTHFFSDTDRIPLALVGLALSISKIYKTSKKGKQEIIVNII